MRKSLLKKRRFLSYPRGSKKKSDRFACKTGSLYLALLIFLALFRSISASSGESGTLYLEEAASANNLSLGKTGISREVGQMWYNPGVLSNFIKGRTLSATYGMSPASFGTNFFSLGYAWPGEKNGFAMGVSLLNNSGLEEYNSEGEFQSNFSTNEVLLGLSHYKKMTGWFAIGETAKLFYLDYKFGSATIFAADFHAFFMPFSFLNLGVSLANLVSTPYNLAVTQESLPVHLRIAPSLVLLPNKMIVHYVFDASLPLYDDIARPTENRIGLEYFLYKDYLRVMLGYDSENFSGGIGSRFKQYKFLFAYLPTEFEERFSVSVTFDFDTIGSGPFARPKNVPQSDLEQELLAFYKGMAAYNDRKYKQAYDLFSEVLEYNPDHKLAKEYRERALLHLKTSKWLDEEQRKLIRLHKELARQYESKENYGEAISEWRMVLKLDPADPEANPNIERIKNLVDTRVKALHNKGLRFYAANDKINAISSFTEALKLNPEYEPSKEWLVKIKQELTLKERAERERIERLQKAEVYYNRGLSYYGNKSFEEAIQQFEIALKMNPKHENARHYLKLAREELEADRKGLKGIEASNVLYQKGMKNYKDTQYYRAMKDFRNAVRAYSANEKAAKMLKKATEKLEAQVQPLLKDGKLAYRRKKFSKARAKFEKVKELDPENREADEYLKKIRLEMDATIAFHLAEGKKAYKRGRWSETIDHLNEVVALDPGNKEAIDLLEKARKQVKAKVNKIHAKALKLYEKKRWDDAIDQWEKALKIDPAFALAQKYIDDAEKKKKSKKYKKVISGLLVQGKDYYQNRSYEKAIAAFEKILSIDPRHREAKEYLAKCNEAVEREQNQDKVAELFIKGVRFYKQRKYDKAIKSWKKVRKLDPENALVDKYIKQAQEAKKMRKKIDFINGQKYYKEGKWLLAKESLERALQEDPGNSKARELLQETNDQIAQEKQDILREADKLMRQGKYEEAATQFLAAYRLSRDPEMKEKQDQALEAKQFFEEGEKLFHSDRDIGLSIEKYQRVLEINPFDKKASQRIREVKEKGKNRINTWMEMAKEAEEKEDFQKAYSLYSSIKEIDPANVEAKKGYIRSSRQLRARAKVFYDAGKEAMALKNWRLAIEQFGKALNIVSSYEDAAELRKKARKELARQKAAARAAAASGKSSATSSSADIANINKGIQLYRQGKYKKAIQIWSKVPKSSAEYSKAQKYIKRAKLKL